MGSIVATLCGWRLVHILHSLLAIIKFSDIAMLKTQTEHSLNLSGVIVAVH